MLFSTRTLGPRTSLLAASALLVAALLPASSASAVSGTDTITTIAGNGQAWDSTFPTGTATDIKVNPKFIAAAPDGSPYEGSVFFTQNSTDGSNAGRVMRLLPNGTVERFAGGGATQMSDGSGNGSDRLDVFFNALSGIAVAGDGTIFVASSYSAQIFKIDPDGTINQLATTNLTSPEGIDYEGGTLYVADAGQNGLGDGWIKTVSSNGTVENLYGGGGNSGGCGYHYYNVNGEGNEVGPPWIRLSEPEDVDVYDGTLYVADSNGQSLWAVPMSNPESAYTIFGYGLQNNGCTSSVGTYIGFTFGKGVSASEDGIYYSALSKQAIYKYGEGAVAGTVDTNTGENGAALGDGGPASAATLNSPEAIEMGPNGELYIGDTQNYRIRVVTPVPPDPECPGFEGDPRNHIVGTDDPEILSGTPDPDIICGLDGNDTIAGNAGNDVLIGGNGNDTLVGYGGDDDLFGNAGADLLRGHAAADDLDGGPGPDTASYVSSTAAVTVRLNQTPATATGGYATGDTLTGIENLIGSNHNDTLTGDSAQRGNVIRGGPGADILRGAAGYDSLDYRGSNAAVDVNLSTVTHTVSGGHAQGDDARGFKNVYGSAYDDVLTGDGLANILRGFGGNDDLFGLGDNDTLVGYAGDDDFDGGDGTDACDQGLGTGVMLNCE